MKETRTAYRILARKALQERTFGRTKRRWEDNVKMHLMERCEDRKWIKLA
jgi:hypothetical protein